jgi:acyl-[acyl-carrier-protein] desaturase
MQQLAPDQIALVNELEPVAAGLLDKHVSSSKEWFPHELVPWSRGRDFEPGEAWDPDEVHLDPAVRSSLFVNLLTEDNLPYYFRTIESLFGATARGAPGCAGGPPRRAATPSCCATTSPSPA